MKNQLKQIKVLQHIITSLLVLFIFGCSVQNNESTLSEKKTGEHVGQIKQSPTDLLAGISKAICYSGFREGQHPDRGDGAVNPSYEETLEDLQILTKDSNFTLIRVYDSGENSQMVLKVIEENKLPVKVLLGIWLKAEISNHEGCPWLEEPIPDSILAQNKEMNLREIDSGIRLSNKYKNIIVSVNVGNEALVEWNDHLVDTDTVITYVKKVKSKIDQPVTVADNYRWWIDNGQALSKAVDFVSIHIYPLWEGQDIDTALAYSVANVEEVCNALPESKIVITEAGWATTASEFGERANEDNQERYYNDLMAWAAEMNITTFFFEAFDEPWKGNPDNLLGAEKHWGIFNVDRTPKKVMKKLYPELN
jgi:exo-beta-1,3-glucanase (GH17 family)